MGYEYVFVSSTKNQSEANVGKKCSFIKIYFIFGILANRNIINVLGTVHQYSSTQYCVYNCQGITAMTGLLH